MTRLRSLAFSAAVIVAIIAIGAICFSVRHELFLPARHSPTIAVSLAMESDRIPVGQKPLAISTVRNIGSYNWVRSRDPANYRIHIEGESGEPPKTDVKITGSPVDLYDYLPPDMSRTMTWYLSAFYDLNAPGKYTVYFEIQEKPGVWLRTNTVQFEMLAKAQ